jgi:hypothetical protein
VSERSTVPYGSIHILATSRSDHLSHIVSTEIIVRRRKREVWDKALTLLAESQLANGESGKFDILLIKKKKKKKKKKHM